MVFLGFQESEPISKYLKSDIPQELKQKIARMGVNLLLKMVNKTFCDFTKIYYK